MESKINQRALLTALQRGYISYEDVAAVVPTDPIMERSIFEIASTLEEMKREKNDNNKTLLEMVGLVSSTQQSQSDLDNDQQKIEAIMKEAEEQAKAQLQASLQAMGVPAEQAEKMNPVEAMILTAMGAMGMNPMPLLEAPVYFQTPTKIKISQ